MTRRLLSACLALSCAFAASGGLKEDIENSVVRIVVHYRNPEYARPWEPAQPLQKSGQGIVVAEGVVLTLASTVSGAVFAETRLGAEPVATRLIPVSIDYDRNLAILSGKLPLKAKPLVIPAEQTPEEITQGGAGESGFRQQPVRFFWKTETGRFLEGSATLSHANAYALSPSFQAQLWLSVTNSSVSGGFGEPIFAGNSFVGIGAHQTMGTDFAILPASVIRQGLEMPAARARPATAMAGFDVFPCTQSALRKKLGVTDSEGGCLVNIVFGQGSGSGTLLTGDLVLSLAGRPLDAWGRYSHPSYGTISFSQLFSDIPLSGRLEAELLREGKRMKMALDLGAMRDEQWVIPRYRGGVPSPYFIRGGLVFQPLSLPYMAEMWGKEWQNAAPVSLLKLLEENQFKVKGPKLREIVILSHVLSHDVNRGLQQLGPAALSLADGGPVEGLRSLKDLLGKGNPDVIKLSFSPGDMPLWLSKSEMKAADAEIQEAYGIPSLEYMPEQTP